MSRNNERLTKENQRRFRNKPNFLLIMVDEERYPPVYESSEIQEWRKTNLLAQEFLRDNGMEFHRHYAGSTACCPSRATLFTGQYPSLHGVTQTSGPGKGPFGDGIFWLDPNSVPTMGDYFRAAGYRTFYKGKWHISHEDILIPGTYNSFPSYNTMTGVPVPEKVSTYLNANRFDDFGFNGWVGPEPHGADPRDSGSSAAVGLDGRDQVYAFETVHLIKNLDKEKRESPGTEPKPWVIVSSYVNPHDITLFGAFTRMNPSFKFEVDPTVPDIPPPPTLSESLLTKPRCQRSYRDVYPLFIQPTRNSNFYRRLYYQLQKNADQQMLKVLQALRDSSFYDNTIVIFTSDHGDMLGAHGGMHQKWYSAYEEVTHVPFIIYNPKLFSGRESVPYEPVVQPKHIETVIAQLNTNGREKIWKYSVYFDNPQFWSDPGVKDEVLHQRSTRSEDGSAIGIDPSICYTTVKTETVPNEFELYNLTDDPLEVTNLAYPENATEESRKIQKKLAVLLEEQCRKKRLAPTSDTVPGMPSCEEI